jgi:hypothetical protein
MKSESGDEHPSPEQAHVGRRTLLVRLAAWGTVLLLAALAFTLRSGASPQVEQGANGPQLNGRTDQGHPVWLVEGDGRVREIRMVWALDCDNDSGLDAYGVTFRDSVDGFAYDGDGFEYAGERDLPAGDDGWVAHAKVSVDGRLASGGAHRGRSSAELTFTRRGTRGVTCRSGRVSWSIP